MSPSLSFGIKTLQIWTFWGGGEAVVKLIKWLRCNWVICLLCSFLVIETVGAIVFWPADNTNQKNRAGGSPQKESTQDRASVTVADYTEMLAWFTGVLAIVGAAGIFFTWNQIRLARKQFEGTERAFVFLDGFEYELTVFTDAKDPNWKHLPEKYISRPELYITRFAVCPRWRNSGNTPTKKMTLKINWRGPAATSVVEYGYKGQAVPFFVAPKAVEQSGFFEIPDIGALVDYQFRPDGGAEPTALIWGRGDYEDIFGNVHFVEWCYNIRLDSHKSERIRASFIQSGEYNRTEKS